MIAQIKILIFPLALLRNPFAAGMSCCYSLRLQLSHGHPSGRSGVTATCLIEDLPIISERFLRVLGKNAHLVSRCVVPLQWGGWMRSVGRGLGTSSPAGWGGGGDIPVTSTTAREAAGELGPRAQGRKEVKHGSGCVLGLSLGKCSMAEPLFLLHQPGQGQICGKKGMRQMATCTPHTMPSSWMVSPGRSWVLPRGWRPK